VALETVSVLGGESAGDVVVDEIVLGGPDLLEGFVVGKVPLLQRVSRQLGQFPQQVSAYQ
jgi:hypothetical protein